MDVIPLHPQAELFNPTLRSVAPGRHTNKTEYTDFPV